jgi:homoserine dehydrogenase
MTLRLALVGFGNVARRLVELLPDLAPRFVNEGGLECRVVGIATRRHGCVLVDERVDPVAAAAHVAGGGTLANLDGTQACRDVFALIDAAAREAPRGTLVVVETTTLDVASGEPAVSHVRAGLAAGAHVITANKGPVACAYEALRAEATRAGRCFLFEGAVLDGVPVFNLVRETLPAVEIASFRGIVNSTTHHVLTQMESGRTFGEALAEMQRAGIAEADPSLDVEGWDAAAKVAALSNVLLHGQLTPRAVARQGITGVSREQVLDALDRGVRLRLVASGWKEAGVVRGRVALEELPPADPLAHLGPGANALILETDLAGGIMIEERLGGLTQTAYALVSDLVAVARRMSAAR